LIKIRDSYPDPFPEANEEGRGADLGGATKNDQEAARWAGKQRMIREVRFLSNDRLGIALGGSPETGEFSSEDGHTTTVVVWDLSNLRPVRCIERTDDLARIGVVPRRDPFRLLSSGNESVARAEGSGVPVAWYNLTFGETARHPSLNTWAAAVDNHLWLLSLEMGPGKKGLQTDRRSPGAGLQ
jgi:hypothetical protein